MDTTINFKYETNENIMLLINNKSNPDIIENICSCGFNSKTSIDNVHMVCPNCKTTKVQTIIVDNNNDDKNFSFNFISELDITNEKCHVKFLKYTINSLNLEFEKKDVDIFIGFEKNKLKTKLTVNDEEIRWLKQNIDDTFNDFYYSAYAYNKDLSEKRPLEILNVLPISYIYSVNYSSNYFAEMIWGIYNKFKYGKNLLMNPLYKIKGEIKYIKRYNDIIGKIINYGYEDYIKYIEFFLKEDMNYTRNKYVYNKKENYNDVSYLSGEFLKKIDIDELNEKDSLLASLEKIKENYLKQNMFFDYLDENNIEYTSWTSVALKTFLSVKNCEPADILNLFELAQRQYYDIEFYSKANRIHFVYSYLERYDMYVDLKPKDIHILIDKIIALRDVILNTRYNEANVPSFGDNINYIIKDLSKYIYKIGGFKFIDNILYDLCMNYGLLKYYNASYRLLILESKKTKELVLCLYHLKNGIEKLYLENKTIEDKIECEEYIKNM